MAMFGGKGKQEEFQTENIRESSSLFKVKAGGEGCLRGVKAESRQMSQSRAMVCLGIGKDMVTAEQGYEGECREAGQEEVKATIFILTTDFSRTLLFLKYEHR